MKDRNVAKGELIGRLVTVVASGHPPLEGLDGLVVDETKNTFLVETGTGREVRVPKRGQRFRFRADEGVTFELDGHLLAYAPQDRTKKSR